MEELRRLLPNLPTPNAETLQVKALPKPAVAESALLKYWGLHGREGGKADLSVPSRVVRGSKGALPGGMC